MISIDLRIVCLAAAGLLLGAAGANAEKKAAPVKEKAPDSAVAAKAVPVAESEPRTIIVSAEGLADPNADTYHRDKGLLLDALRADAKRQVIEKAVGTLVESNTLVENYTLVHDKVLNKSAALIKSVIKESDPFEPGDGFAHLLMKAEVYLGSIQDTLEEMSKVERVAFIKDYGNPKISVAITVRDADRASETRPERSEVAENIVIEELTKFGYRVWSEEAHADNEDSAKTAVGKAKAADFAIQGEGKFKTLSAQLTGGTTVTKYVLTSLSMKCINNHTAEVIAPQTEVPKKKSWADEDGALEEIGHLVTARFNNEFFQEHLMSSSRIFQLQVVGLPDYETGTALRQEMLGLRPVLNVDFRDFDEGVSNYEVEFAGTRGNFTDFVNDTVVKPLNLKFNENVFKLKAAHGDVVRITYAATAEPEKTLTKMKTTPPASLTTAAPERIKDIPMSKENADKIAAVNQGGANAAKDEAKPADPALDAVKSF